MLPAVKQSECGGLRYTSQVLWRISPFDLSKYIADQLRGDECNVDDQMKLVADFALQDVEHAVSIAAQMQVRELRLDRFPRYRDPIVLDFRTAWTPANWSGYVEQFSSSSSSDADDLDGIAAIDDLFADQTPPLRILYGGCCGDDEQVVDPDTYQLQISNQGDALCLIACDTWPCVCTASGCDSVRIRYIAGYPTPALLALNNPRLLYQILSTFGFTYETPELMQGSSNVTMMTTQRRSLKWKP